MKTNKTQKPVFFGWTHEKLMNYHSMRNLGVSPKSAAQLAIRGMRIVS